MKKTILSLSFIFLFVLTSLGQVENIVGIWKTIDDGDGTAKSIVRIYKATNGKYFGKIEKLFKDENKLCTACEGANKNKPIKGMIIINNMEAKGDGLTGGTILDPNNGKTYRCNISIDGKTGNLKVRGSLDKSGMLGRTQTWIKSN